MSEKNKKILYKSGQLFLKLLLNAIFIMFIYMLFLFVSNHLSVNVFELIMQYTKIDAQKSSFVDIFVLVLLPTTMTLAFVFRFTCYVISKIWNEYRVRVFDFLFKKSTYNSSKQQKEMK